MSITQQQIKQKLHDELKSYLKNKNIAKAYIQSMKDITQWLNKKEEK